MALPQSMRAVTRRGPSAAGLAALALTALAVLACRAESPEVEDRSVRVLVIGLDGATWDFIDPLLARGALPHLAELIRGGVRARLDTLDPAISPAVWTTIATGKAPDEHGVLGFGATDESGLVSSSRRRTEALWTILSRSGLSAGFVGWWVTWPAEAVSVYDLTPTILHVLGLPVGQDMGGRVLQELLVEPRDVGHIATNETGRRGGPDPKSPVEDDLREQLRSLGYIR